MKQKPVMRGLLFAGDDSVTPRFVAEASTVAMLTQARNMLHDPFAPLAGHTMPWPAEPGSGKCFLLGDVLANVARLPAKSGKKFKRSE